MAVIPFPTLTNVVGPAQMTWGQRANNRVHVSPLSGSVQTVDLPGARWTLAMRFPHLYDPDRAAMEAFLAQLRGQANTFTVHDFARPTPRGAALTVVPTLNRLLWSNQFSNAAWYNTGVTVTADATANPEGTANDADQLAATSGTSFIGQNIGLFAPLETYTFSVYLRAAAPVTLSIFLIDSIGNTATVCNVTTAWQRFSVTRTIAAGATSMAVQIGGGTTFSTGETVFAWGAQVEFQPAATPFVLTTSLVASRPVGPAVLFGGQFGSQLGTWGWAASTPNVLLPGDKFSVNGELKVVTSAVGTGITGYGLINFEPPLRASPADGTQLILTRPTANFMLTKSDWSMDFDGNKPGCAMLSLDAVEVW